MSVGRYVAFALGLALASCQGSDPYVGEGQCDDIFQVPPLQRSYSIVESGDPSFAGGTVEVLLDDTLCNNDGCDGPFMLRITTDEDNYRFIMDVFLDPPYDHDDCQPP